MRGALAFGCGCALLVGIGGCSETPGTLPQSVVRDVASEPEQSSVKTIYQRDPSRVGVEDMALAIAVLQLPTDATETQIVDAANRLLEPEREVAAPLDPLPSVVTVDYAEPIGSATIEDVAVVAAALNLPLLFRREDILAFVSSNVLVPRGDILSASDIVAIPGVTIPGQQGTTIAFADPNLEAAVRASLNISSGPIPAADAARLTFLNASDRNVTSLQGIENLINLNSLFLFNNDIEDLTPLAGLTELEELGLFGNIVSDLSPISSLPNLEILDIRSNQVSSISDLSSLPKLRELELGRNPLTNFTSLGSLAQLEILNLSISEIDDLSILSPLTSLTELNLDFTEISSYAPLSNLDNLEVLSIQRAENLEDISFLSSLNSLRELNLRDNAIRDLAPLTPLTALTKLELESNAIADISALTNLTQLEELNLANNPVTNIDALENLVNLSIVDLEGDRVTDLQPLIDNPGLGAGDAVNIRFNPVEATAIATLTGNGVEVAFTPLPEETFEIEIEFIDNGLPQRLRDEVRAAAARWERAIVRGLPDATFERAAGSCSNGLFPPVNLSRTEANPVDDVLIQVAVVPLNGPAGRAGPCVIRKEGLQLPAYGTVRLDTEFVNRAITEGRDIINVTTHEIGHVLGIGSNIWDRRVVSSGSNNPLYVGDRGRGEYEALGGSGGVPIQVQIESHWRQNDVDGELMTPANGTALSRITLGALADFGYEVDLNAADSFALPLATGSTVRSFIRTPQFDLYDDVDRGPIYLTN
ncbi:MAG: leucine-rich repeat domain-containing protein [Cyanobacteria bacterium P01_F01_bin.33]